MRQMGKIIYRTTSQQKQTSHLQRNLITVPGSTVNFDRWCVANIEDHRRNNNKKKTIRKTIVFVARDVPHRPNHTRGAHINLAQWNLGTATTKRLYFPNRPFCDGQLCLAGIDMNAILVAHTIIWIGIFVLQIYWKFLFLSLFVLACHVVIAPLL